MCLVQRIEIPQPDSEVLDDVQESVSDRPADIEFPVPDRQMDMRPLHIAPDPSSPVGFRDHALQRAVPAHLQHHLLPFAEGTALLRPPPPSQSSCRPSPERPATTHRTGTFRSLSARACPASPTSPWQQGTCITRTVRVLIFASSNQALIFSRYTSCPASSFGHAIARAFPFRKSLWKFPIAKGAQSAASKTSAPW